MLVVSKGDVALELETGSSCWAVKNDVIIRSHVHVTRQQVVWLCGRGFLGVVRHGGSFP